MSLQVFAALSTIVEYLGQNEHTRALQGAVNQKVREEFREFVKRKNREAKRRA
jgi:hypothetical protein